LKATRLIPLAAAGALALSTLGGWTPAQADTDSGYVIGTVTDTAGRALPGAYVEVYWCDGVDDGNGEVQDANGCWGTNYGGDASTDRNGQYKLSVSNYTIAYLTRPGRTGSWIAQADGYPYAESAWVPVPVTPRANTTAPTFALAADPVAPAPANAALTGLVTDAAGAPIGGAGVYAYDAAGQSVDYTETGSDGRYYFTVSDPAGIPPAQYAENNVTGSVRLFAVSSGRQAEWSGDTLAKSRATAVPVAAYGSPAASAPTMALASLGSVTGSVKLPAAGANWGASVTIYDLDGNEVGYSPTDAAGNFSADVAPGTYYVRADGYRYTEVSENDPTCPACTDYAETFGFVAGYYGGGTSLADAKPLKVGSGTSASAGAITLTNALKAVEKPAVKGKLKNGELKKNSKLKVSTGTWNRQSNVTYSYVWKVGSKKLGTKSTLKITKKVQKKIGKKLNKLTVTVTATDVYGELVDGSSKVKVKKALTKGDKDDKGGKGKGKGKGGKK